MYQFKESTNILDSRPLHLVIDLNLPLGRDEVFVSSQFHNELGREAGMSKLGDEASATRCRRQLACLQVVKHSSLSSLIIVRCNLRRNGHSGI